MKLDLGRVPCEGKGYFLINPDIARLPNPHETVMYTDDCPNMPEDLFVDTYILQLRPPWQMLKFDFKEICEGEIKIEDERIIKKFNPQGYRYGPLGLVQLIFGNRTTTALWGDGTMTEVVRSAIDRNDPEKAVAALFMKRLAELTGTTYHRLMDDVLARRS